MFGEHVFKKLFIYTIFILAVVLLFSGCKPFDYGNKKAREEEKKIFGFLNGYNHRIKEAQGYLVAAGFDPGPVDGAIDRDTRKVIRDYQKINNLKVTGFIDSETWTMLSSHKARVPIADNIREVQEALKDAGFDPGPIDGKIGLKTKNAITRFQTVNSLTANGQLDSKTMAKLKPYFSAKK